MGAELYAEALPVIEEAQKDSIEHGLALLNYAEMLVGQLRETEVHYRPFMCRRRLSMGRRVYA